MKMGAGIFWGAFLLLLGIALIIKVVFQVEFPVFKVVVGIFLVLIGLKVLFGRTVFPSQLRSSNSISAVIVAISGS